ncbi:MAG: SpoIIE family protein phosphatase [Lachnospiraceae bacterium]|nr:SpoIIE family protein phosphatase [Lachnospiraceae bacterium]
MGLLICTELYYSCMKDRDLDKSSSTKPFVLVIFLLGASFALLEFFWATQGYPQFNDLKYVLGTLNNGIELFLVYSFWDYVRKLLRIKGELERLADIILKVLLVPSLIYVAAGMRFHHIFTLDAEGYYIRSDEVVYSDYYLLLVTAIIIVMLIMKKEVFNKKGIVIIFILIPMVNYALIDDTFIAAQSGAILVGVILAYIFIFSKRTAALERKESELDTASEIQTAMLPTNFPYFTKRKEFDIYASSIPAREVGGDFYDFFLIDDNHLCMIIADVSDKGVPAALFMVSSKTNISNYAKKGKSPAAILEGANNEISSNNEKMMFVSVWLGILELSTGKLIAANGGHEYPAIYYPETGYKIIKDKHGPVLGAMPGIKYEDYEIQLKPGSSIFVYTDGVIEATNEAEELFGEERLEEVLNSAAGDDPKEVLETVQKSVDDFQSGVEQFDDITMLSVHYYGFDDMDEIKKNNEITIDAKVENIDVVQSFIAKEIQGISYSNSAYTQLCVAIEEMYVNVASYAYPDGVGEVTLKTETDLAKGIIKITIIDNGIEYNPLAKEDPDVTLPLEERPIGGLGIYLTKRIVDNIAYDYIDGQNVLTIEKLMR